MAALSNSDPRRDDPSAAPAGTGNSHNSSPSAPLSGAWDFRPVQRPEIESALRILLANPRGPATDEQVLDFLSFSVERNIDTNAMWIAIDPAGRIAWTMLPVTNPGRTMLIFSPARILPGTPLGAIMGLTDAIGDHFVRRGVQLAQMLIDPNDRHVIDVYRTFAGFDELAELIYLQKTVRRRSAVTAAAPHLPAGMTLVNYSADNHARFVQVIQRSYEQSLDCPALNGLRDMNDVIVGHQATGEFDSRLWFMLLKEDQPIAVLLLARLAHGCTLELVYLGIVPEARGQGIGDWLMKFSFAQAASDGREHLSLAVDSKNQPALDLYYRHGMKRIGSRVAMLRDLRRDRRTGAAQLLESQQTQ